MLQPIWSKCTVRSASRKCNYTLPDRLLSCNLNDTNKYSLDKENIGNGQSGIDRPPDISPVLEIINCRAARAPDWNHSFPKTWLANACNVRDSSIQRVIFLWRIYLVISENDAILS